MKVVYKGVSIEQCTPREALKLIRALKRGGSDEEDITSPQKVKKTRTLAPWTEEQIKYVLQNLNAPISMLKNSELLADHTKASIATFVVTVKTNDQRRMSNLTKKLIEEYRV